MHWIDGEQVARVLDMPGCIRLMKSGLIALSSGRARQMLRPVLPLHGRNVLGMMPAFDEEQAVAGVKVLTVFPHNYEKDIPLKNWYESKEWPPAEATLTELYFDSDGGANSMHGDGRLVTKPREGGRWDAYVYDPENVATGCGKFEPSVLNPLHARQDYLVYESDALEEAVAVAGNLSAVFYASSSAVDTDFFVTVSDVDEKGVARKISTNGIRAEFRNWPEVPSALLEPGKVEKYHLYLHFAGHVFQPGHKIRVDICSADYITFFPNTNTGVDPYTDPEPIVATNTIYHGEQYPSCVRLPILYGRLP